MKTGGHPNLVIPIAGRGSRFHEGGYRLPKPLIPVRGRAMLHWALDSLFPHFELNRAIFVCLKSDLETSPIARSIHDYCPGACIVSLDAPTEGQAHTVYCAGEYLDTSAPLFIYNCDTFCRFRKEDAAPCSDDIAGHILCFRSSNPSYSYVELGVDGSVARVAEKEAISPYASTGLYCFAKARWFLDEIEAAMTQEETVRGEYYVAPMFNRLIAKGRKITMAEAECCMPMGTPAELKRFEGWCGLDAPGRGIFRP